MQTRNRLKSRVLMIFPNNLSLIIKKPGLPIVEQTRFSFFKIVRIGIVPARIVQKNKISSFFALSLINRVAIRAGKEKIYNGLNYSVFHTLLAFVSRRTCTFETFYPPAFISLIAACNIAAATAAAISFTVSNAKGNPFSFITFRVLFHTVSFFILSRNSCPSQVSLPT